MRRVAAVLLLFLLASADSEAAWFRRDPPRPGHTTLSEPVSILQAQIAGGYFIVTAKWDRRGPYNFLIDTGATTTLVTPTLAQRYGVKTHRLTGEPAPGVQVTSSEGETLMLEAVNLRRLELGDALFENVPSLVYDCNDISVHLGLRIDGILGFPLFREVLLSLDYPHHRVLLASTKGAVALQPGTVIHFENERRVPIIPVRIGDTTIMALIDTGSDTTLRLNPIGIELLFLQAPRPGPIVASLTGDRRQTVARLNGTVLLGDQVLEAPVVELLDEFPTIGGGVLKYFVVTFDQENNRVTLHRDTNTPVTFPSRRSTGISVTKAGAYWRVAGVIPESPAARAGIGEGDLITRINDEPVEQWSPERFQSLVDQTDTITHAFLIGRRVYELKLPVMNLVP